MVIALMGMFSTVRSQTYEPKLGAWYMYFWNTQIKKSDFGFQGDIQYRNWNLAGDLEQLLLRGGVTYTPRNTKVKLTAGYGYILSSEFGPGTTKSQEHRIYQEALIPQGIDRRVFLTHRFRLEERFVENQNFRIRYRYNLFVNIPFNKRDLKKGAVYAALYNELFINGNRNIGDNRTVEIFDRNRSYVAIGYSIIDNLRVQAGYMQQITNSVSKGQVQVSLHHRF